MPGTGSGYRPAVSRLPIALAAALLMAGGLTGCAPGTPDEDSWRVDAIRVVGDVDSSVATMALALRHDDDLFHPYLQTVAVNAEDTAGRAAQKLSARQPPDAYVARYEKVTSALDDADSQLADARIAVLQRRSTAYDDLAAQLGKTADQLSAIEDELRALPDDRSEP